MIKNRLMQDEHEKYFFGYSSSEVYSLLEESVKRFITEIMDECKTALIEENVCVNVERIDREISELESLYMTKCMEVLVEFKSVLRDIFKIPDTAPIYKKSIKRSYTKEDITELQKDVNDLQQKYLSERMIISHAKKEKEILENFKPSFQLTKMILDQINETDVGRKKKIEKFNEKVEECLKKLSADVRIDESPGLAADLGI